MRILGEYRLVLFKLERVLANVFRLASSRHQMHFYARKVIVKRGFVDEVFESPQTLQATSKATWRSTHK